MKKNNFFILLFLLSLLIVSSAFSQETITVTTYYPSPSGVYENLRFFPTTAVPACDANNEGITYYDNTTNLLMVCRQTGIAPNTYGFQSASSLWTRIGTTGPNGADPIAIRPFDTNLKVGIGDVNMGWNRSNMLSVTDNTSINVLNEQIALMEILNPRRGSSGVWSGANDSVTALILSPGGSSWQVRADEFDSSLARTEANAGTFMIHQDGVATRLVIRNDGNVGVGTQTPQAKLDVAGTIKGNISGLFYTAESPASYTFTTATTSPGMKFSAGAPSACCNDGDLVVGVVTAACNGDAYPVTGNLEGYRTSGNCTSLSCDFCDNGYSGSHPNCDSQYDGGYIKVMCLKTNP